MTDAKKQQQGSDAPSRNPDFKGATPADVARTLWRHRPEKSSQKNPKKTTQKGRDSNPQDLGGLPFLRRLLAP